MMAIFPNKSHIHVLIYCDGENGDCRKFLSCGFTKDCTDEDIRRVMKARIPDDGWSYVEDGEDKQYCLRCTKKREGSQ